MAKKSPIVIFGAGFLGNDAFRFVRRYGFSLYGFMDNNPKLWHTEHLRHTVYAPQDITDIPVEATFLIAIERDAGEVRQQLLRSGISDERIQVYSHRMEAKFYQNNHSGRWDINKLPYPKGEQDDCMGCGACVAVCDRQAVSLQTDEWDTTGELLTGKGAGNAGNARRSALRSTDAIRRMRKSRGCMPFMRGTELSLPKVQAVPFFPCWQKPCWKMAGQLLGQHGEKMLKRICMDGSGTTVFMPCIRL